MAILFLGDFYYGYNDIKDDIREIAEYIHENNYSVILNLEGPITNSSTLIKKRGEHLRQSNCVIKVLKMLNVVGVSLANNHIMDFGEEGLKDTIELLNMNHIQHSGAGCSIEEASKPIIFYEQGQEYYVYCMTDSYEEAVLATKNQAGCAPVEINCMQRDCNLQDGIAISFLHTGFEYNTLPMPRNVKEAKQLIEEGVEYVICSHPHLVQPKMYYKKGRIYFSLGNFYFSNFRLEFSEKIVANRKKGFCNIGYGVLIGEQKESFSVSFCPDLDKTIVNSDSIIEEIESDQGFGIVYIIKCWKNRNNHNPILLGERFVDNFLLRVLDVLYFIYALLRGRV